MIQSIQIYFRGPIYRFLNNFKQVLTAYLNNTFKPLIRIGDFTDPKLDCSQSGKTIFFHSGIRNKKMRKIKNFPVWVEFRFYKI